MTDTAKHIISYINFAEQLTLYDCETTFPGTHQKSGLYYRSFQYSDCIKIKGLIDNFLDKYSAIKEFTIPTDTVKSLPMPGSNSTQDIEIFNQKMQKTTDEIVTKHKLECFANAAKTAQVVTDECVTKVVFFAKPLANECHGKHIEVNLLINNCNTMYPMFTSEDSHINELLANAFSSPYTQESEALVSYETHDSSDIQSLTN